MRSRGSAFTDSVVPPMQGIRFWMRAPAVTINLAAPVSEAALLMIENKSGGLPVIDEQRIVTRIITESVLFEALVQQLDAAAEAAQ